MRQKDFFMLEHRRWGGTAPAPSSKKFFGLRAASLFSKFALLAVPPL
jgi:hypothetical protein